MTQLINSFLAVVAHPWDQLLDKVKLKNVTFETRTYKECGFPHFPTLPVDGTPATVDNVCELLRVLRNGMAHGNMELLDRKTLRKLRQTGPLPRVTENEIAGIKLCNRKSDTDPENWCTALDIHELRETLKGMMRLREKRSLWKDVVRLAQHERDAQRKSRRS